MYAALQGDKGVIDLIAVRLARSWSFDVFLDKNRKGNTAESMAVSNDKLGCAEILKSTRVRMLQRMHKQLALIHYSAELRGWKGYTAAYRAAKIWQSKNARRRATLSLPILNDLNERWTMLNVTHDHHPELAASMDRVASAFHGSPLELPHLPARSRSCIPMKHVGETQALPKLG